MSGFLNLEGMKGEAVVAGKAGWIAVDGVRLGEQSIASTSAPRRTTPDGETQLHFTCRVGNHSPSLMKAATEGTSHEGELALMDAGGRYATVKLLRAMVTGYQSGSAASDGPMEAFTLETVTPFKLEWAPRVILRGRWLATVGAWTGYFVFEAMGTVYWTERNGTGRQNGIWKVTPTDVQWKFAGGGDIRTFVIPVPIASDKIEGRILPAGQGVFTMQRA
jgi:type VI protein secretion system component Hcp